MTDKVEILATYRAIGLLGRQAIDKLVEQGLIVVSAKELEKLKADLTTQLQLNKEAEAFCLCQGWKKVDSLFNKTLNSSKENLSSDR